MIRSFNSCQHFYLICDADKSLYELDLTSWWKRWIKGSEIHGCIGGYSRRILWLEVSMPNKDPAVVAKYYLNWIQEISSIHLV